MKCKTVIETERQRRMQNAKLISGTPPGGGSLKKEEKSRIKDTCKTPILCFVVSALRHSPLSKEKRQWCPFIAHQESDSTTCSHALERETMDTTR